ncbi:MAG: hypothetical protein ACNYPH_06960 [Gammaproteobacteria bacterium WSBS_2016_MAG_OTU1]
MNYEEAKKKMDDFRGKMLERMIKTAQQKECIFYSKLIHGSGVEDFLDSSRVVRKAMSGVLHSIGLEIGKQNNIMLTAVVVNKLTSLPSNGFYKLAAELGKLPLNFSEGDKKDFWSNELKKVQQYYQEEKQS